MNRLEHRLETSIGVPEVVVCHHRFPEYSVICRSQSTVNTQTNASSLISNARCIAQKVLPW